MQERQGLRMWPEVVIFHFFPLVSVSDQGASHCSREWGVWPLGWSDSLPLEDRAWGRHLLPYLPQGELVSSQVMKRQHLITSTRRQEASRLQPPRRWWSEG